MPRDGAKHAALEVWRDVVVRSLREGGQDLTARQMAILLTVYLEQPPHTVRGLAALLGISKPAVTRALDTLTGMELVRRKRDETDRRSVLVQRTVRGAVYMTDFGDVIRQCADNRSSTDEQAPPLRQRRDRLL
jgi:DNA-binding MarR family transcriptional regulator